MIAFAKKTFIWLWMAALLSATIGVSVRQVYCYCGGKTTISLFEPADVCLQEGKGVHSTQSAPERMACCAQKADAEKYSCCEKRKLPKRGCTKKTTQVFQLKTEFEVVNPDLKKLEIPKVWALDSVFLNFSRQIAFVQNQDTHRIERAPPPLSGRTICLRHGVFRC